MIQNHLFIIGAQRCGTTYLYNLLDSHPEIYMAKPVRPEPKFFIDNNAVEKGRKYYENKYFSNINSDTKILGEKGTSYIEYPHVSQKIKKFYKDAKFIVLLRNPVERAISNYYFSFENKLETRSIEDVFLNNAPKPVIGKSTSVYPFAYLERGIYINYLPVFQEVFKNNLKIILFEDLFLSSETYIDIYDFLNVDNSFVSPYINAKINQTVTGKNKVINPAIYKKLYAFYRAHNIQLEQFLGRKTNWNND